ncbi:MAG TPA: hypothetical protein VGP89_08390, partial [Candidatus Angelobacter sp.]|nr:hypothetical protein [Candidatus Angelobacter sp.]
AEPEALLACSAAESIGMFGMPRVPQLTSHTAASEERGSSNKIRTAEMRVRQCTLLLVCSIDANT